MLIIAGLGNPGAKYVNYRHNVGFMAADAIVRRHSFSSWSRKFQAEIATGTLAGERVLVMKPQTFMNNSGQAVGEAMRFHKLTPADIVVLYDELDLAPGKVRIKTGGGAGGHNGIRSIDAHCGKDYRRVRIGIGHPGVKEMVTNHVLGDFAKADHGWLDPLLDAIGEHAGLLVEGNDNGFMNKMSLAVPKDSKATANDDDGRPSAARPKGPSHIRQARPKQPAANLPESGPMAAMLKRLFGKG
ncbi:MAG: aminoacyl-tRNA hydrolase [Rhizobiaceae bacterium]|nr:aminoacyl-tRNA hydrolase [Rhizobiaceae bacterium]MCV0408550.1 aminoacyl-tRNA hydrolase [Rhizobiaceae bacterium]